MVQEFMSDNSSLEPRENKAIQLYERVADMKISTMNDFIFMGELLKEIKKIVVAFEDETNPEIKQAHELHKALIARKNRWAEKFQEAEELAKDKLANFLEKQESSEIPKLEGVSFTEQWSGEVVDASLIPRDYLMPDIKKLVGVTKALKEATNIPGWQAKKGKTVSVRT